MQASINAIQSSINSACKGLGGVYSDYSCTFVSWDDVSRFGGDGYLSCVGPNITDTRLYEQSGRQLFTVRSDNWNEKLGRVSAEQVALVVGNALNGGTAPLRPITLREFLQNADEHGAYVGVEPGTNLYKSDLDSEISIRFQTTFLPIDDGDELAHTVFCTEAYNYNTYDDTDPRNAVVLCTTQGIAFNTDRRGNQRLYHHAVGEDGSTLNRYWLEAERTRHKVGGSQAESKEEAEAAAARGKATASVIGIEAMGTRLNVLMTIQIPLQQRPRPKMRGGGFGGGFGGGLGGGFGSGFGQAQPQAATMPAPAPSTAASFGFGAPPTMGAPTAFGAAPGGFGVQRQSWGAPPVKTGVARAARVSRGPLVDSQRDYKLPRTNLARDEKQHITITVVIYNVVAGGVPSLEDVKAAIDDMEHLYQACQWRGNLRDHGADFMKEPKVTPFVPTGYVDGGLVMGGSLFPKFTPAPAPAPVPAPVAVIAPPVTATPQQHTHADVTCDRCGKFPVVGTRYRCLQCPNFDLCEACEQLTGHTAMGAHTPDHVMLKVRNPFPYQNAVILKDRTSLQHGAACNFCGQHVVGHKFVCQDCHATFCEHCDFSGCHPFEHRVFRSIRP